MLLITLSDQDFDNLTRNWTLMSNESEDPLLILPATQYFPMLTILYLAIFVIGVIGNSLVIIVIIKDRKMRSVANFFLVSLSAADLMIILFCVPVAVYELYFADWIFGDVLCKFSQYLQYLSVNASILTMLSISIERLFVICVPLKARSYCTKRRTMFIIAGVWTICALFSLPASFVATVVDDQDSLGRNITSCINDTRGYEWYIFFEIVVFYICPGCLLFVIYSLIIKSLRQCSVNNGSSPMPQNSPALSLRSNKGSLTPKTVTSSSCDSRKISRKRESRQQLIFMLGAVVITYFICLLPFHVVVIMAITAPHLFTQLTQLEYTILLATARVLFFINSCVNPILYNAISGKFRAAFVRLFKFNGRKDSSEHRYFAGSYRTVSTRRSVISEMHSTDDGTCSVLLQTNVAGCATPNVNAARRYNFNDNDAQHFL